MPTQIDQIVIACQAGLPVAAHVREIMTITMPDGSERQQYVDPRPLAETDRDNLLGIVGIDALVTIEALSAQLATQTEALAQLEAITAERDALLAQVAELTAPPTGRVLTIEQYRDRFTSAELVAVLQAAYAGDANCQLLLLKVQTATNGIDLDSESVSQGLAYLTSIGILKDGRAAEIRG